MPGDEADQTNGEAPAEDVTKSRPTGRDDPTTAGSSRSEASYTFEDPHDRGFTCTGCGFETRHRVRDLRARIGATCLNCGDWTIQTATEADLVDATEAAAAALAGDILTERQALAYLLRDVVGFDRQSTASVMDSSPSNVDNLQRRAGEKIADARRVVAGLDALAVPAEEAEN